MKLGFYLMLLLLSVSASAQKISGLLRSGIKPLDAVEVLLLDTTLDKVQSVYTNADGVFEMQVDPGVYILAFKKAGYDTRQLKIQLNSEDIYREIDMSGEQMLEAATVTAEKKTMQLMADKKVFQVDKSLMADIGTAQDVLSQIPTVNVSSDGEVSIRGKSNVTILIDGVQTTMFGNSNEEIIQQLPASSIENIEVMTNPSAKYDAQGMSGIINIRLKKTSNRSRQYSASLGLGTAGRYSGKLQYNTQKGNNKWAFNLSGLGNNADDVKTTDRLLENPHVHTISHADHEKRRARFFLNATYRHTWASQDYLELSTNGGIRKIKNRENNVAQYLNTASTVDSSINRFMPLDLSPWSLGGSLNYKKFLGSQKKQNLNTKLDFNNFRARVAQDFYTQKNAADGSLLGTDTAQIVRRQGHFINGIAQMDYSNTQKQNWSWEAGAKYQFTRFVSTSDAHKYFLQETVRDSVLENSYDYTQNLKAVYVNLQYAIADWSLQAGLRYEDFAYLGTMLSYDDEIQVNYRNLFPSVFLNYRINEENSSSLSYSKRVNRPSFFQLFPYLNISDPLNARVGNPELKPEYIHNMEWAYMLKKKKIQLISTLYTQYTQDIIQRLLTFRPDGSSLLKPYNLLSSWTYGLELAQVWNFHQKGDWTLSANGFNTRIDGSNFANSVGNQGMSWFLKSLLNYQLPHHFKLQWTTNYLAKTYISQGVRSPYWWTDLALRKSFGGDRFSVTVNANDIFNTYRIETKYEQAEDGLYQYFTEKPRSQYVMLSLSWNFSEGLAQNGGKASIQDRKKPVNRNSNFEIKNSGGGDGG